MKKHHTFIYSLVTALVITAVSGHLFKAQAHAVEIHFTPAAADTALPQEFRDKLVDIADRFDEMGFNITPIMHDNRFEVYETLDQRFEGSAENTIGSLEEYKEVLDFNEKAGEIDDFIAEHIETLKKAEQEYGISKYIIAATIAVESNFGRNVGDHNPFNVYISMMVLDYREDFARAQLKNLLEFVNRKDIDVLSLKSSYAGAMGYGQFIPYSINKWWVGDELYDMDDNIYSIANYLAYFKERVGDRKTMILRYNPSSLYANFVLDLAAAAEKSWEN